MMTVTIVMLTELHLPVRDGIGQLISAFDMICIVDSNDGIPKAFPSIGQLFAKTFANISCLFHRIDPCCCPGVVVNIKVSITLFIVGPLPAGWQDRLTSWRIEVSVFVVGNHLLL